MAGSIFSATAIPVTITAGTHGTEAIALGSPPVNGATSNVNFISPTLTVIENNPSLLPSRAHSVARRASAAVSTAPFAAHRTDLPTPWNTTKLRPKAGVV